MPKTTVVLTAAQLAAKAKLDAARADFNASIGKTSKPRVSGFGGFTGTEVVTVAPNGPGFGTAEQQAIAKFIGKGKPMADLFAANLPGFDGLAWVTYRLRNGGILLNGLTVAQAYAIASQHNAASQTSAGVVASLTS